MQAQSTWFAGLTSACVPGGAVVSGPVGVHRGVRQRGRVWIVRHGAERPTGCQKPVGRVSFRLRICFAPGTRRSAVEDGVYDVRAPDDDESREDVANDLAARTGALVLR